MSVQTWLGLLGLGVLAFVCVQWRAPAIQAKLQQQVDARLDELEAHEVVRAKVVGRDVVLEGAVASDKVEDAVEEGIRGIWGVRRVDNRLKHTVIDEIRAAAPGPAPVGGGAEPLVARLRRAARSASEMAPLANSPDFARLRRAARSASELAPLANPALDTPEAHALSGELTALLERQSIEFRRGHHDLSHRGVSTVGKVFDLLEQAPTLVVEIGGHTDTTGTEACNLQLSRRRAQTVAHALIERGIEPERLVPLGFGSSRPRASNRSEQSRRRNRRIEFRVIGETEP